jgi:hypothetical protein
MSRQLVCCLRGCASLLLLVGTVTLARGDEPKDNTPKDKPSAAPTALQIAQWIKDLDSDDFQVRQQATGRLIAAGKHAAGQVAKAAEGESAEVTARCMDILAKLLQSTDAETKTQAKQALEGLTKSKNAALARQATALVNPVKPAAETPRDPALPGAIPGAPRIGGFGIAGPGMRVSVKNVDGNKTIEAEEGGKKTKIEESAKGGIKVEVTETVDGKEKVSKYEAKDAEELKKKHPEASALYEKYSKFAPGIAVRFGIGGGAIPGGIARPLRVGVVPQKALDQIEEANKQLADAAEKLRKLAAESRISPEEVKKLADQIEAAKKQLDEARSQLPK